MEGKGGKKRGGATSPMAPSQFHNPTENNRFRVAEHC